MEQHDSSPNIYKLGKELVDRPFCELLELKDKLGKERIFH